MVDAFVQEIARAESSAIGGQKIAPSALRAAVKRDIAREDADRFTALRASLKRDGVLEEGFAARSETEIAIERAVAQYSDSSLEAYCLALETPTQTSMSSVSSSSSAAALAAASAAASAAIDTPTRPPIVATNTSSSAAAAAAAAAASAASSVMASGPRHSLKRSWSVSEGIDKPSANGEHQASSRLVMKFKRNCDASRHLSRATEQELAPADELIESLERLGRTYAASSAARVQQEIEELVSIQAWLAGTRALVEKHIETYQNVLGQLDSASGSIQNRLEALRTTEG